MGQMYIPEPQLAFNSGYDWGFANPHVKANMAKAYCPYAPGENFNAWMKGFKEGKKAVYY